MHHVTTLTCLAFAVCLALPLPTYAEDADVEVHDGTSTQGWVLPPQPAASSLARVAVDDGAVAWTYERGTDARLVHGVLTAGLEQLELRVRSEHKAVIGVVFPDREGRAFFELAALTAGQWTDIRVRPGTLRAAPGVKGDLDPRRLGLGYVIVDKTREAGPNTLSIDEVRIRRTPLPQHAGPMIVEGDTEIATDIRIDGDVTVRKGARLRITAARVEIHGDLRIEEATVEVVGSALSMPQRFNHERKLAVSGTGRLDLRDALVITTLPLTLDVNDRCRVEMRRVAFAGGVTCAVRPDTSVHMEDVTSPGEFILLPGGTLKAVRSSAVLFWLAAGPNVTGTHTLPDGAHVASWEARHGWHLTVEDCTKVWWGLVSLAGSDTTFARSAFRAVGLHFGGRSKARLSGLHNGKPAPAAGLLAADRTLRFVESPVETWNVYASLHAHLTVEDSTIGEALAFMDSTITIERSVCDGSGGYVGARENSRVELTDCTIRSLVVARDASTIVLVNCTVEGDVRATDNATVHLRGSTVSGRVEADPGAVIVRK